MVFRVDTLKTDLRHYAKHFKGRIDKDFCDTLMQEMNLIEFETHKFYDPVKDKFLGHPVKKDISVNYDGCPSSHLLTNEIWYIIRDYIDYIKMPWFDSWSGFLAPRFNKYDKDVDMGIHCDHIQSMFEGERKGIPLLSVVGVLNDDYEGGEFVMFDDTEIKFDKGDVLVFPSLFLYPHKVEPVKSGTRYSYVSWVW